MAAQAGEIKMPVTMKPIRFPMTLTVQSDARLSSQLPLPELIRETMASKALADAKDQAEWLGGYVDGDVMFIGATVSALLTVTGTYLCTVVVP